jgi:hypothetical protein
MKMSVSPVIGCSVPPRAADSSARSAVVPTATMRPPAARVASDGGHGPGADLEPLAVHAVLGDALHAHRLEGAGADMQRHARLLHAALLQRLQQRLVEVQRRRGRRHGSGTVGEDGLVARLVLGRIGVL